MCLLKHPFSNSYCLWSLKEETQPINFKSECDNSWKKIWRRIRRFYWNSIQDLLNLIAEDTINRGRIDFYFHYFRKQFSYQQNWAVGKRGWNKQCKSIPTTGKHSSKYVSYWWFRSISLYTKYRVILLTNRNIGSHRKTQHCKDEKTEGFCKLRKCLVFL